MIHKTKNNWLFFKQSRFCHLCSGTNIFKAGLCQDCFNDLPWLRHSCERCSLPLQTPISQDTLCPACFKRPPPFDRIISALEYRFPVDQLIQAIKFNHQSQHLNLLAELLIEELLKHLAENTRPDIILPVPMDRFRLLHRQFNHSALLVKRIASVLSISYRFDLLIKPGKTEQQSGLNRQQRQRNLRNKFCCTEKPPAHVAIIDDVVTTGATAIEIARTLKQAGAQRVDIWSVARTGKGSYL
ncbi:MAG: ComF family protein [Amphritea sp.]|nr:ComF family protein [Amphritea sp.]